MRRAVRRGQGLPSCRTGEGRAYRDGEGRACQAEEEACRRRVPGEEERTQVEVVRQDPPCEEEAPPCQSEEEGDDLHLPCPCEEGDEGGHRQGTFLEEASWSEQLGCIWGRS